MTNPASESCSPASTLSRLVLPAPLRPTSPTLSPAATVKLASDKTRRAATSMARLRTWSTSSDVTQSVRPRLVCINTGGGHMKRFLVIFAIFIGILVAAAACGAGSGGGGTTSRPAGTSYLGQSSTSNGAPVPKGAPDRRANPGPAGHTPGAAIDQREIGRVRLEPHRCSLVGRA